MSSKQQRRTRNPGAVQTAGAHLSSDGSLLLVCRAHVHLFDVLQVRIEGEGQSALSAVRSIWQDRTASMSVFYKHYAEHGR